MPVTARPPEAVGGTVAGQAFVPVALEAAGFEPLHGSLELLGTLGAPAYVAEAGLVGLGQHQAVMEEVSPTSQVHRLSDSFRLVQPHDLTHEAQRVLGAWCEQLDVGELRYQAS